MPTCLGLIQMMHSNAGLVGDILEAFSWIHRKCFLQVLQWMSCGPKNAWLKFLLQLLALHTTNQVSNPCLHSCLPLRSWIVRQSGSSDIIGNGMQSTQWCKTQTQIQNVILQPCKGSSFCQILRLPLIMFEFWAHHVWFPPVHCTSRPGFNFQRQSTDKSLARHGPLQFLTLAGCHLAHVP